MKRLVQSLLKYINHQHWFPRVIFSQNIFFRLSVHIIMQLIYLKSGSDSWPDEKMEILCRGSRLLFECQQ